MPYRIERCPASELFFVLGPRGGYVGIYESEEVATKEAETRNLEAFAARTCQC